MTFTLDWDAVRARLSALGREFQASLEPSREQIQRVYRERAARLAESEVVKSRRLGDPLLVFRVGGERYSIRLADVAEILPRITPTRVPGVPPYVAGVVNIRERLRPLVDLRRLFDVTSGEVPDSFHVLLLSERYNGIAVRADRVENVTILDPAAAETWEGSRYSKYRTRDTGCVLLPDALAAAVKEFL